MRSINFLLFMWILFTFPLSIFATDYTINSVDAFNNLTLLPGDNVIWQDGTYASDERIKLLGTGTANAPITLKAQTPGGVVFTGGLQMDIAGDYLVVDGFYWNGGYGASNFIQFRSGEAYAQNCTIKNCVINGLGVDPDDLESGTSVKHRWIVLYGNYNNVLNCSFMNKSSAGALVLVELEYNAQDNRCSEVGHTISNNYFYKYDKINTSLTNAGDSETIRVGTSEFQNVNCATTVSNNYFVEADGENEIITNKSANNTYINNTFRRCRGSLVLRHGAGAIVQGNIFLGENVDGTGGIRIVDSDHTITNNYIQDCITVVDQAKWNNGITFMGGGDSSVTNCNSSSVSNGYQKSENIILSNNTFVNTNAPLFYNIDKGSNDVSGTVADNIIYFDNNASNSTDVISGDTTSSYSSIGTALSYSGNVYNNTNLGETANGFTSSALTASSNGEIFDISGASNKGANLNGYSPTTNAMVGNGVGACFLAAEGNGQTDCDGSTIPTESLTVSSINDFNVNGNSQTVTVTSNLDWTVSENSTWISINNTSGTNNGAFSITTTENTSDDDRSATVTVSGGAISRSITVSQEGEDLIDPPTESCTEGTNLSLNGTIANFSAEQNTTNSATKILDADGRWSAETFPQYVTIDLGDDYSVNQINLATLQNRDYQFIVDGSTTSATSGFSTLVDASNNTSSGPITETFSEQTVRYVKLTITGANSYTGEWISIAQFKVICAGGDIITPTENLTISSINNFDADGNSQTVTVTSNLDWTVSENSPWISINNTSGTNNGAFSITTTENTSDDDRSATVTISGGAISRSITVSQEGEDLIDPPTESCTEGTNLSLNGTIADFSTEQNTTNTVTNILDEDGRWSAETFPQYATIDLGASYSVNEVNVVTLQNRDYQFIVAGSTTSATSGFSTLVDASNNTSSGPINSTFSAQTVRYVKLTITGANSYTGEWASITKFEIICAGGDGNTPNENLAVSSINNFDTDNGSQTITVTSNVDWSVSENSSWISISNNSGSNNDSFTINVTENTNSSPRNAIVTVSSENLSQEISVTQNGVSDSNNGLDASLAPSENFDLTNWNINVPIVDPSDGDSTNIQRTQLNDGYELKDSNGDLDGRDYFYTGADGGMVFRNYPKDAPKTSSGTSYSRTELREILTDNTSAKATENNWYFSSSDDIPEDAGGVDGVLTATLAINHVTTKGDDNHQGRLVIGQIHASNNEPNRLYYHKLPQHDKGALYVAHEEFGGNQKYYNLIGNYIENGTRSDELNEDIEEPTDGIALDEKFSYRIEVQGNDQLVTISRAGKADIIFPIDMSDSEYENDYMYFKAGVYSQNNTTNLDDDYDQATFYALSQSHNSTSFSKMTSLLGKTKADQFEISIFPNPYVENITISTNNNNQEINSLELLDFSGRTIIKKPVNTNKATLSNLGRLESGVYFLRLLNTNNKIIGTKKLIKD